MSSAVISTSAALSRPFLFDAPEAHVGTAAQACPERSRRGCPVEQSSTAMFTAQTHPGLARHDSRGRLSPHKLVQSARNHRFPPASISPASSLPIRPAPDMASSGIPALDALTGGLPRGCLTELCGSASSGRTTVLLAALAAATRRGEFCALIDASDSLDPQSATAAGIDLDRLLWVRCGDDAPRKNSPRRHGGTEKTGNKNFDKEKFRPPILSAQFAARAGIPSKSSASSVPQNPRTSEHRLEQVLRTTDLLLESGGFGLIVLDLADIPLQWARRIPMTTWFRFRRAVEHKSTMLLSIAQHPIAGSCSSLLLQLGKAQNSNYEPAAKRQKNTAHGASCGLTSVEDLAQQGRKKLFQTGEIKSNISLPSHAQLLTQLQIHAEPIRSRLERKPSHSITFESKTAWAG